MGNLTKAEKCRALIWKRPALESIGYDAMIDELGDIQCECDEIRYTCESDTAAIIDALDGNEEEAAEFQMLFSDLSYNCEQLFDRIGDMRGRESESFDDLTVALIGNRYKMVGWDDYEEDWYSLTGYQADLAETEAGKRIMRHTKAEMLSMIGQAMGIVLAFFDLRQKYDYLKATMDIIRGENASFLKTVSDIENAYAAAAECEFYRHDAATRKFDDLVSALPDKAWLE